jgi:hypothetical protein
VDAATADVYIVSAAAVPEGAVCLRELARTGVADSAPQLVTGDQPLPLCKAAVAAAAEWSDVTGSNGTASAAATATARQGMPHTVPKCGQPAIQPVAEHGNSMAMPCVLATVCAGYHRAHKSQ